MGLPSALRSLGWATGEATCWEKAGVVVTFLSIRRFL
jgi:hypothetical protein